MPPPVLVGDPRTLDGLARDVPDTVRALVARFWPGGLTVICLAQPSLAWDLGETNGTVALRQPDHPAALALLARTGPLAVSSANKTGQAPTTTATGALDQLGDSVSDYLDGGTAPGGLESSIVDATGSALRLVRAGAISLEVLREVAEVEAGRAAGASTSSSSSSRLPSLSSSRPWCGASRCARGRSPRCALATCTPRRPRGSGASRC